MVRGRRAARRGPEDLPLTLLRWLALVGLALVLVTGALSLLFALQRAALFPAPAPAGEPPLAALGARRTWVPAGGGLAEAWLLPAHGGRAPAPLVVFAHGNGELIDSWAPELDTARRDGAAVLLVEYPGYGRSGGRPSEASVTEAMVGGYDWAVAQPEVDPARVVGWGRSLGGGAVCALAAQRSLATLVLESTFTSVRGIARGLGMPGFLVRDPFDNVVVVRGFGGPVLVLHGARDELIPAQHARDLHAAAKTAELRLLPCGHNDCPFAWQLVRGFLRSHGLL